MRLAVLWRTTFPSMPGQHTTPSDIQVIVITDRHVLVMTRITPFYIPGSDKPCNKRLVSKQRGCPTSVCDDGLDSVLILLCIGLTTAEPPSSGPP